jgi:hypothetical protein
MRLYFFSPANRHRLVRNDSILVLEGFPRSANSFTFHLLDGLKVKKKGHIAHHLHGPGQLLFAASHAIPMILIIRSPLEACQSLVVREQFLDFATALEAYIRFHEPLIEIKDLMCVFAFEDVIRSPRSFMERNLAHFPGVLAAPRDFENWIERAKKAVEQLNFDRERGDPSKIALPNPEKLRLKEKVLVTETDRRALVHAEELYLELRNQAEVIN